MINIWKIVATILVALYPLAIYFGLGHFEPRYLALFLCLIIIFRFFTSRAAETPKTVESSPNKDENTKLIAFVFSFLLMLAAIYMNSLSALMLYPVIVNSSLLVIFWL